MGYPSESAYGMSGKYLYRADGEINLVSGNGFRYSSWTMHGFSGGPILHSDDLIVGIHHGVNTSDDAFGKAITVDMINLITSLR